MPLGALELQVVKGVTAQQLVADAVVEVESLVELPVLHRPVRPLRLVGGGVVLGLHAGGSPDAPEGIQPGPVLVEREAQRRGDLGAGPHAAIGGHVVRGDQPGEQPEGPLRHEQHRGCLRQLGQEERQIGRTQPRHLGEQKVKPLNEPRRRIRRPELLPRRSHWRRRAEQISDGRGLVGLVFLGAGHGGVSSAEFRVSNGSQEASCDAEAPCGAESGAGGTATITGLRLVSPPSEVAGSTPRK